MRAHHHDPAALREFGFTRNALVAIFLHNLLARHYGTVPKLEEPLHGRKYKQPGGILRSEVKYFLSLYPDARQWGDAEWGMFLHMNTALAPDRLFKYVDKLIHRATISTLRG